MAKGARNRQIRKTAAKILPHYEPAVQLVHPAHEQPPVVKHTTKSLSRRIRKEGG